MGSIGHQLRVAGFQSVWAPACQDHIVGAMLVLGLSVWVVLLWVLPHLLLLVFGNFIGLAERCGSLFLLVMVGFVTFFVVYGYQGAEEDLEKLLLTDRLHGAVLAGAQVVCVGQPILIVGDLNADPGLFLVWPSVLLLVG